MFSFFKQKVLVSKYSTTAMNTIFSVELTAHFLRMKSLDIFKNVNEDVYLSEFRAAFIELFKVTVDKNYSNILLSFELTKCIEQYVQNLFGNTELLTIYEEYNKAFGSSGTDGVREMAKLCCRRMNVDLNSDATERLNDLFYSYLSSSFKEIDKIKLVIK